VLPDAARRVTIHLFDECNNLCVFCATAGVAPGTPTHDELRAMLTRARSDGANEVTFVGGEPTLAPGLIDAVTLARAEGFTHVGIQTTGHRLAVDGLASKLARAGATDVHISVHAADPTAHDYHTGMPGSFVALLSGVAAARSAGLTVVASTVLTRSNYRVLVDMPRWLAARSIAAWCVWVPRVAGRLTKHPDRIVPRLAMALPYALHALDTAAKHSLPAWISGAPLCLLGPFAARAIVDGPRVFGEPCTRCSSQSRCSGVDAWYLARFGALELIARVAPPAADDHASLRRMLVGPGPIEPATASTPNASLRRALLPVVRDRS